MNDIEEMNCLIMRVRNLRAQIGCAEEPDMVSQEKEELREFVEKLEDMQCEFAWSGKAKLAQLCVQLRSAAACIIIQAFASRVLPRLQQ